MDNQNIAQTNGKGQFTGQQPKKDYSILFLIIGIFIQIIISVTGFSITASPGESMMAGFFYIFIALFLSIISSIFYFFYLKAKRKSLWYTLLFFFLSIIIAVLSLRIGSNVKQVNIKNNTQKAESNYKSDISVLSKNLDEQIVWQNKTLLALQTNYNNNSFNLYNPADQSVKEVNEFRNSFVAISNDNQFIAVQSEDLSGSAVSQSRNSITIYKSNNKDYWEISNKGSYTLDLDPINFSNDSQFYIFGLYGNYLSGKFGILDLRTGNIDYLSKEEISSKTISYWPSCNSCDISSMKPKYSELSSNYDEKLNQADKNISDMINAQLEKGDIKYFVTSEKQDESFFIFIPNANSDKKLGQLYVYRNNIFTKLLETKDITSLSIKKEF